MLIKECASCSPKTTLLVGSLDNLKELQVVNVFQHLESCVIDLICK